MLVTLIFPSAPNIQLNSMKFCLSFFSFGLVSWLMELMVAGDLLSFCNIYFNLAWFSVSVSAFFIYISKKKKLTMLTPNHYGHPSVRPWHYWIIHWFGRPIICLSLVWFVLCLSVPPSIRPSISGQFMPVGIHTNRVEFGQINFFT